MVLDRRRPLRPLAAAFCAAVLCGCGSSTAPELASTTPVDLGPCTGDVSDDSALVASLVPGVATVKARQQDIDRCRC